MKNKFTLLNGGQEGSRLSEMEKINNRMLALITIIDLYQESLYNDDAVTNYLVWQKDRLVEQSNHYTRTEL